MNTSEINLYKVAKDGGTQVWRISVDDWIITIRYGRLGGALLTQTETVEKGLASRSRRQQVISRVRSRINKQLDRGYKKTLEEAKSYRGTDAVGNLKPMLAHPLKRVSRIDWSCAYVQPKYDGHRMLCEISEDGVRAWSRQGKAIDTVDHIFSHIGAMLLPPGTVLDGELYRHGTPLQTIASWVKRKQTDTYKLKYVVYDIIDDCPFDERLIQLKTFGFNDRHADDQPVWLSMTSKIGTHEELNLHTNDFISLGYEGSILRHGRTGYEIGVRSNSLVKVKKFLDDEFKCVDIKRSRDGWAVLTLETSDGKKFGASAPGTVEEKRLVLDRPNEYLGRMLTLEYSQLTKDGIPFHPVAKRWREDI